MFTITKEINNYLIIYITNIMILHFTIQHFGFKYQVDDRNETCIFVVVITIVDY